MIHIVTCLWNAEKYISKCIDSVRFQNYTNYKMHIVDDISDDKSYDIIASKINSDPRFLLTKNNIKQYKLKNFDNIISNTSLINDDDIIVELDGDDWLAHQNVLDIVQYFYDTNPQILIANGRFVFCNGNWGFSNFVNIDSIRTSPFTFSHLRSWKAKLWRQVDKRYFIDPNSSDKSYFNITADMAYSLPMLEIAGKNRYMHLPEILLVYNDQSPYNDHKPGSASGGQQAQQIADRTIRALRYE